MRAVLSFFVLLATIYTVFVSVNAISCKYGEEYKCINKLCETTCANKNNTEPCNLPCTPGCYCSKKYARISYDRCKPDFYCEYKDGV
ncbi:venom serine protease inhibitor-like [Anopheles darlingi]|uniref:venom serine protease inhibitor-like n=1 Tax=Anopheles darlingi TaxID=43151 RepID=UPI0021005744|nr:venom serine protease inhibitor-like [Anopheles darlingi]